MNNTYVTDMLRPEDIIYNTSDNISSKFSKDDIPCKKCPTSKCYSCNNDEVYRGCCKHCAVNNGYFNDRTHLDQLKLLKFIYKFDSTYGFFDRYMNRYMSHGDQKLFITIR